MGWSAILQCSGATPLLLACYFEHLEVVRLLLSWPRGVSPAQNSVVQLLLEGITRVPCAAPFVEDNSIPLPCTVTLCHESIPLLCNVALYRDSTPLLGTVIALCHQSVPLLCAGALYRHSIPLLCTVAVPLTLYRHSTPLLHCYSVLFGVFFFHGAYVLLPMSPEYRDGYGTPMRVPVPIAIPQPMLPYGRCVVLRTEPAHTPDIAEVKTNLGPPACRGLSGSAIHQHTEGLPQCSPSHALPILLTTMIRGQVVGPAVESCTRIQLGVCVCVCVCV